MREGSQSVQNAREDSVCAPSGEPGLDENRLILDGNLTENRLILGGNVTENRLILGGN